MRWQFYWLLVFMFGMVLVAGAASAASSISGPWPLESPLQEHEHESHDGPVATVRLARNKQPTDAQVIQPTRLTRIAHLLLFQNVNHSGNQSSSIFDPTVFLYDARSITGMHSLVVAFIYLMQLRRLARTTTTFGAAR